MDSRPTVVEIDLAALRHNFGLVKRKVPKGCGILAVVKADAYGHGFQYVSEELEKLGVDAFAVAFLAEGVQLRMSGIYRPVLILGGVYPGEERRCIGLNISTALYSLEQAAALDQAALEIKCYRKAKIHLKVDTGMGRLGVPWDKVPEFLEQLKRFKNLEMEGIFSHFASADELDQDGLAFTKLQAERFNAAVVEAHRQGFDPRYIHVANSAAILAAELPFCNLVRPGIILYGAAPSRDFAAEQASLPVMKLKSRVAMLKWVEPGTSISYGRRYVADKRALIASVPVGYADGYCRSLTNKGEALIRGKRARVAGTVCMDWIMLDVTDIEGVAVGDDVTLLGPDPMGDRISAEELAEKAGTIPYEIMCGIATRRVRRVYIG
ncbi:alanine racemase [Geomonas sp. Red69]|uniref:Alanine racemase n=1 Tax=Geomonas diazotrophica TaxID=2843197 RepID=A0ABX8JGV9_9BACT|nr:MULTISPECIES: alanine racemase [Geomonas]MBU5635982.1 alanine racemase [Geomonas diazotrophica]QWV96839.1 alanine racemase [Geomonas nitrogeniifigens]